MRKRRVWIGAGTLVLLLIARQIFLHVSDRQKERAWYISSLHYKCSAKIDSVIRPGRALISITQGTLDGSREWKLKSRLRHHRVLHLAIGKKSTYDLRVPEETIKGDSLLLDSDQDKLKLYRKGELLVERPLSNSLRASQF